MKNRDRTDATGWQSRALCAGIAEPDLFFPDHSDPGEDAKAICRDCPVAEPCGDYALDNRIREGVWGGLTESDREELSPGRSAGSAVPLHASRWVGRTRGRRIGA